MQRYLGIKKPQNARFFNARFFSWNIPEAFSYCRGKMKNGTIKPKCVHALVLNGSKNVFLKDFTVADCKVKIFCSTEMVNEDTIGIPSLFPVHFSLFPRKQMAVKMTSFSEKWFYFCAVTITSLAREWLNECFSSSLNFEHYQSKLKYISRISKSHLFLYDKLLVQI